MDPVFDHYLQALTGIVRRGDFREPSFYPALKLLLEGLARNIEVTVEPRRTEGSNPDFRVWARNRSGRRVVGYVEAKTPGEPLDPAENSEQLRRYRSVFPNLILTDFLEFRLYRHGQPVASARLARLETPGRFNPRQGDFLQVRQLLENFLAFQAPPASSARELAQELAKLTRLLGDAVRAQLPKEPELLGKTTYRR